MDAGLYTYTQLQRILWTSDRQCPEHIHRKHTMAGLSHILVCRSHPYHACAASTIKGQHYQCVALPMCIYVPSMSFNTPGHQLLEAATPVVFASWTARLRCKMR
jgi:hypothetical protein